MNILIWGDKAVRCLGKGEILEDTKERTAVLFMRFAIYLLIWKTTVDPEFFSQFVFRHTLRQFQIKTDYTPY